MYSKVLACVDHSGQAGYVADYAAWLSYKLTQKLELLHLIDLTPDINAENPHEKERGYDIHSALKYSNMHNNQDSRLEALKESGQVLLKNLKSSVERFNPPYIETVQTTGTLMGALLEKQNDSSLIVLGRKAQSTPNDDNDSVKNLEFIIKTIKIPILTVPCEFKEPKKIMVTFNGTNTSKSNLYKTIETGLLKGVSVYLLMSGDTNPNRVLDWAHKALTEADVDVFSAFIPGTPHHVIQKEVSKQNIDLVVMGAYTSSPLVRMVAGSKTDNILRSLKVPALIIK